MMNSQKIICPLCGMEFRTREEHEVHHEQMHGRTSAGAEMTCIICGYSTRNAADMEQHKKNHTQFKM